MDEKTPIWKFDRVCITSLTSIYEHEKKSNKRCHATIDFGFFYLFDIGISRDSSIITWSNEFGWSQFRFSLCQLDNPYCEEVTKLARMIKEELDTKKVEIRNFLDNPHTFHMLFDKTGAAI